MLLEARMSNRLRHSILAYGLLATVLYCCWQLLFSPSISNLKSLSENNNSIQARLSSIKNPAAEQELSNKTSALLLDHTAANEQLQTIVKTSISAANGEISQLLPNSKSVSDSLQLHNFDVRFKLTPSQLAEFFNNLSSNQHSISLDSINLRLNQMVQPKTLEANATFSLLSGHLNEGGDLINLKHQASSDLVMNGLFNKAYRKKLKNPGIHHYQLKAAIVSSTTKVAIIFDNSINQTKRYKLNDKIDGWVVTQIKPTQVTLSKDGVEQQLQLKQNKN